MIRRWSRPLVVTILLHLFEATAFSLEVPHLLERLACRESAASFKRKRGTLEISLARRRGIERDCRAESSSHQPLQGASRGVAQRRLAGSALSFSFRSLTTEFLRKLAKFPHHFTILLSRSALLVFFHPSYDQKLSLCHSCPLNNKEGRG